SYVALLVFTPSRADCQRLGRTACRRDKRPVYKVVEPLQVLEIDDTIRTVRERRVGAVDIALKTRPLGKLCLECTDVGVVTANGSCDTGEVGWTRRSALVECKAKALALVDRRRVRAESMSRSCPAVQCESR